jgi:hypothetical protein
MTTEQCLERLERLERENRWIKRCAAAATAVVAVVVLVAQGKQPDVLEARELILRSRDGGVATLRADLLTLVHANGKSTARLGVDEQGLGLSGLDADGRPRVGLLSKDDSSELWFFGASQRKAVQIAADNGGAVVKFHELKPARMPVMVGTTGKAGTAFLSFFGPEGRNRLSLGVQGGSPGMILFYDAAGKRTSVLPK